MCQPHMWPKQPHTTQRRCTILLRPHLQVPPLRYSSASAITHVTHTQMPQAPPPYHPLANNAGNYPYYFPQQSTFNPPPLAYSYSAMPVPPPPAQPHPPPNPQTLSVAPPIQQRVPPSVVLATPTPDSSPSTLSDSRTVAPLSSLLPPSSPGVNQRAPSPSRRQVVLPSLISI